MTLDRGKKLDAEKKTPGLLSELQGAKSHMTAKSPLARSI